jgi:hypothetical protein
MTFDEGCAVAYINLIRWQFAKTMPDWPHEYTVKAWRTDLEPTFTAFCQLILSDGCIEPWPPAPADAIYHNHYLVIAGHKYWAMGPLGDSDPVDGKSVINRETYGRVRWRGV